MLISTPENLKQKLLEINWFKRLPEALFLEVNEKGKVHFFTPGQWLYGEGDKESGVVAVLSGCINIWSSDNGDSSSLLGVGAPGTVIGQSRLLGGGERLVTVMARTESTVFILADDALQNIAIKTPEFWKAMVDLLYTQLQRSLGLCALLRVPSNQRVARRLLALQGELEVISREKIEITQHELADLCQISRESLNAHLKDFESRGWVSRGYKSITINSQLALKEFGYSSEV